MTTDTAFEPPRFDVDRLTERASWLAFAPGLHIEDPALQPNVKPIGFPSQQRAAIREQLRREGYLHAMGIDCGVDLSLLAATVRKLSVAQLSPVFAFLFDEFWIPFRRLAAIYQELLGDYAILPDFWVWHVDPKHDQAGWAPHRDKGAKSLFPDGMPKSLTTWIPLTPATPLSSCMYIVPAMLDPTYGTADDSTYRFAYQDVRALPAQPGDVLIWNQAVVHWGSRSSALAAEPRISMAVEFQRRDVPALNTPLINPLAALPFDARLKLIARQILQYRHMYRVAPTIEKMALALTQ